LKLRLTNLRMSCKICQRTCECVRKPRRTAYSSSPNRCTSELPVYSSGVSFFHCFSILHNPYFNT